MEKALRKIGFVCILLGGIVTIVTCMILLQSDVNDVAYDAIYKIAVVADMTMRFGFLCQLIRIIIVKLKNNNGEDDKK